MSYMKNTRRYIKINHQLASLTWCICIFILLAFCLLSSSAERTKPYKNNRSNFEDGFFGGTTSSRISSTEKVDLIRFYLMRGKSLDEKITVVIDTADNYYGNIKLLWKIISEGENIHRDIMLFVYNDTACSFTPISKEGNRTITDVLEEVTASSTPMSDVAVSIMECLKLAVEMINSNNSITLFTGRKTSDGISLGESTGKDMMKKGVKFNCIWFTNELGNNEEIKYYKEIARYTNGNFIQFAKDDHNEIIGGGFEPRQGYGMRNDTKSDNYSLDIERTHRGMKISGDESADMLYDPKMSEYNENEENSSSLRNSARIVNLEKNKKELEREALEAEDMEFASLTAIESAARLETTSVEVTAATSLVGTPGSVSRLTFTVTNNYPVTIRHYFQGRSTSFSLVYLEPRNAWIESGQTVNVVADVLVPTTATSSTIGTVTLVVQSIGSIEKSAYIYVRATGSTIYDTAKPSINYSFNNNCAGKLGSGTCSNNLWSVDVTVQDSDSGLQRVTSSPNGIQPVTSFISGTKSSTKFQYAATCCQKTVVITADDLLGNSNSETIDVTVWYNLSDGEIAAIIIGTLLLLLIIVIIIIAIIFCIRRRRKRQELPFTQRVTRRPET